MVNAADLEEVVAGIDKIWANPPSREGRFGNVLRSVAIRGIRGLSANVEFTWPVTAIAGTNGSGKTTFLQVASAAYVAASGGRQVNLGSWIRGALRGDTPPIRLPASIAYSFADQTPSFVVDYVQSRTRWDYPRRGNPVRNVEFIGITTFAPRVEKKDRVHHARGNLQIRRSSPVDLRVLESVSRILGNDYTELTQHEVGVASKKWSDRIPQITRSAASYSEPHMGAGEQKVVRLVETIEAIPKQSLILLEEPELTLHPDAQAGLAWYLMAVAKRNGHQIIIATHSEHLFQALPQKARVLIVRTAQGTEILHGVSGLRAAHELSRSMRTNAPLVLVEDEAAAAFLREILRQTSMPLHRNCAIVVVGNDDDVLRVTKSMRGAGIRAVGVRDGDKGESEVQCVLSLPGGAPPESVLLGKENVEEADRTTISGASEAFARASPVGRGHAPSDRDKRVLAQMASELGLVESELASRLTQAWIYRHRSQAGALATKISEMLEA